MIVRRLLRKIKCLGATSRWTSWTFNEDDQCISGCHNSWNMCGGILGRLLPCWQNFVSTSKLSCCLKWLHEEQGWNASWRSVAWPQNSHYRKEMPPQQTSVVAHSTIACWQNSYLAQPVFIGHSSNLDTDKSSHF